MKRKDETIRADNVRRRNGRASIDSEKRRSEKQTNTFITTAMEEAVFLKTIDKETTVTEVMKHIRGDKDAAEALKALKDLNCDEKLLAWKLYMYGGGSQTDVQSVKQGYRRRLSFMLSVSKRMLKLPGQIKKAYGYLADAGIAVSDKSLNDFVEIIQSHAGQLSRLGTAVMKDPGSLKVTARNHHLVFLAKMNKVITGNPHYKELAALADCVRAAYGDGEHQSTAENIRDLIRKHGELDFQSAAELELIRQAQARLQRPPK